MRSSKQKRIIVLVTSDLVSDNRVHKFCSTLDKMGFSVKLIGRRLPDSLPLSPRKYETKRLNLVFKKGPLFYTEFNLRTYLYLLFTGADLILANDLDALPAGFLASKVKMIPLVYDSHEYFTEVPELIGRPKVRKFWEKLEKTMLPEIKYNFTVCDSIAAIYNEKYDTVFQVVRNLPYRKESFENKNVNPEEVKTIIYQGAVNVGRGLKQAILAMKYVENAKLIIAGSGDIKSELEELVNSEQLVNKVEFTGKLPLEELYELTRKADLGLSIEEDLGLNYRFALPNKLFDYIQARIPVLVTDLPEMAAIVRNYNVGEITSSLEPVHLANTITDALLNMEKRAVWMESLDKAASELVWENEEIKVKEVFSRFL